MSSGFKMADAYIEVTADTTKAEKEASGLGAKISKGLGAGMAAAGAGAAGLLAKGFADNMNIEVANDRLAGQLGLTQAEADKAGKAAGAVYANNWGGSIEDVNAAIQGVGTNLGDVSTMGQADLESMATKALALAQTFDVDVNASTQAAGKLIKTGLVADANEAFDLITAGFQSGLDPSGDWLDTLNEYSTQFRSLGLSGSDAASLIAQGVKAGARDADIVADALKEFALRTQGSLEQMDSKGRPHLTALGSAFESVGLSGQAMYDAQNQLAAGGEPARAAFAKMQEGLRGIQDPAERTRTAVALFGTQAEDMGHALFALDLSTPVQGLTDVAGAADAMANTIGDNAQGKIDTFKRKLEGIAQSAASSTGPLGLVSTGVLTFGGGALAAGAQVGQLVTGMGALNLASVAERASTIASTIAKGASAVASGVAAAATGVWTGAQWLLNAALTANPIGIVIVVIAALVAAIVIAYKNSETFRNIVQAAMKGVVQAWDWVWEKARAVFSWLGGAYQSVKGFITNPVSSAVKSVVGFFGDVITRVKQIPGQITGAFSSAGSLLAGIGRKIIDGLIGGIQDKFNALRSKLGEVTNLIPSWKGPEDKDKNLLRPAGRLIMGGLQQGIDESLPSLQAQLGGITANIAATPVTQVAASTGGGGIVGGEYHFHFPPGTLDMLSDADRLRAVRQMRDELVKLEGGTR